MITACVTKAPDTVFCMTSKVSVKDDSIETSSNSESNYCSCCFCKDLTFVELPNSIKECNTAVVDQEEGKPMTIFNGSFVSGYFLSNASSFRSHTSQIEPARKVNVKKKFRDRYRIPHTDRSHHRS